MFSDHNHALKVELRIREYANESKAFSAKKNLIIYAEYNQSPIPTRAKQRSMPSDYDIAVQLRVQEYSN